MTKTIDQLGKREPYKVYFISRWYELELVWRSNRKHNTTNKEEAETLAQSLWEKDGGKIAYRILFSDEGKTSTYKVIEAKK